ncbi:hypothetical protein [Nocardioides convexus]|uniref:hypothetical protein n=1 Tax=Nocardioides convexus TaxID=2712224 RepID=UPI0024185BC5|nr:hypothetical protein [Nocardioides convexus]
MRRFPGDGGAVGLVAVEEDFFVVVRVAGQQTRVMLSDITAASEWEPGGRGGRAPGAARGGRRGRPGARRRPRVR